MAGVLLVPVLGLAGAAALLRPGFWFFFRVVAALREAVERFLFPWVADLLPFFTPLVLVAGVLLVLG